jgi:hypothetical protein
LEVRHIIRGDAAVCHGRQRAVTYLIGLEQGV